MMTWQKWLAGVTFTLAALVVAGIVLFMYAVSQITF